MEWNIVKQAFEDMKTHHESEIPKLRTEIKQQKESWLNSAKRKEDKDKINSEMKNKLQGAQGRINSNENLIRDTEERQETKREWKWDNKEVKRVKEE